MFGFLKNEVELFFEDMGAVKSFFSNIFAKKDKTLYLNEASILSTDENKQSVDENQERENSIFENAGDMLENITNETVNEIMAKNITFKAIDTLEEVNVNNMVQASDYINDNIDNNIMAYLGEDIDSVRNSMSGNTSQHEILREYAKYFKPYSNSAEMCNAAFKKYYDRNALDIGQSKMSVDQMRIIQNNVDVFVAGEEGWGEDQCFIDSRVDDIFRKVGSEQIKKVVNCLSENTSGNINTNGERLLAESLEYMIENSIKIGKDKDLMAPVKRTLEDKLVDVSTNLAKCEEQEECAKLLSDERKYLHALNRIEKYEEEQKVLQYEQNLEEIVFS